MQPSYSPAPVVSAPELTAAELLGIQNAVPAGTGTNPFATVGNLPPEDDWTSGWDDAFTLVNTAVVLGWTESANGVHADAATYHSITGNADARTILKALPVAVQAAGASWEARVTMLLDAPAGGAGAGTCIGFEIDGKGFYFRSNASNGIEYLNSSATWVLLGTDVRDYATSVRTLTIRNCVELQGIETWLGPVRLALTPLSSFSADLNVFTGGDLVIGNANGGVLNHELKIYRVAVRVGVNEAPVPDGLRTGGWL